MDPADELLRDHTIPDPADAVVDGDRLEGVQTAIAQLLSSLEVDVLRLYVGGASYAEISQTLNRHTKAVDNAIQRIKRKVEGVLQAARGGRTRRRRRTSRVVSVLRRYRFGAAGLAQLAEHLSCKEDVVSSILTTGSEKSLVKTCRRPRRRQRRFHPAFIPRAAEKVLAERVARGPVCGRRALCVDLQREADVGVAHPRLRGPRVHSFGVRGAFARRRSWKP